MEEITTKEDNYRPTRSLTSVIIDYAYH